MKVSFAAMNKEEESLYFQNLEEFIFEENKIVTYQWLSKTLELNVNLAKQLLYTFVTRGSKKDELSATYLLAGVPKNGIGYRICVIKNTNLEEAKKSFLTLTSEHVYSVQQSNALSDLNLLYTVDGSEDHKNNNYKRLSSIDFDSVERDSSEIAVLRAEALPVVSKQPIAALKKTVSKLSKPFEKSPKKEASPKKETSPKKQTSPKENGKSDKAAAKENDKKPTVASMFAKATANKKPATVSNTATQKRVQNTQPKPKGIGAFFSKGQEKAKEIVKNGNNEEHDIKMEVDNNVSDETSKKTIVNGSEKISGVESKTEDKIQKEDSPKSKSKQPHNKGKVKAAKGKKRTKKSNDDDKIVKKRRRIVVMSESESSSEEENDHHMEREPTPPPQPTVIEEDEDDIIQGTPEAVSKRHRRRLVTRMFTDADGYMCTKKEYITESCSDEETDKTKNENGQEERKEVKVEKEEEKVGKEEVKVKKVNNTSKPVSKKQKSPQKTKQTNLTSFFRMKS